MSMINFSIIIPHYNIPALLVRAVNSIPKRDDVQIIVVDDGSPNACDYLTLYPELSSPNVEVLFEKHKGSPGAMRNIGLQHAVGKWVTFIDADDFLVSDASEIFDFIIERSEDILYFDTVPLKSDDLSVSGCRSLHHYFEQYDRDGDENPFRYCLFCLWGKVFRRDFINCHKIQFDKTKYSADCSFSIKAGYYAGKILVLNKPLYCEAERMDSLGYCQYMTGVPSVSECLTRVKVAAKVRAFAKKHNIGHYLDEFGVYVDKFRHYHKFAYIRWAYSYLFIHPSFILPYIKQDIKSIQRRVLSVKQ